MIKEIPVKSNIFNVKNCFQLGYRLRSEQNFVFFDRVQMFTSTLGVYTYYTLYNVELDKQHFTFQCVWVCIYFKQGLIKGENFFFRNPYFYCQHGENTYTASQLTSPATQKSKDLNKVSLLLQDLGYDAETNFNVEDGALCLCLFLLSRKLKIFILVWLSSKRMIIWH